LFRVCIRKENLFLKSVSVVVLTLGSTTVSQPDYERGWIPLRYSDFQRVRSPKLRWDYV
jgi:hypothetical protein